MFWFKRVMNKINRNNYESYFLDFLEGNITPEDSEQLKFFLEANEDLKEELYSFESIAIKNEKSIYPEKVTLKKQSILNDNTNGNFDYLCIAKIEGDLLEKESKEFDEFIRSNKEKEIEFNRFLLTRLKPDDLISFTDKKSLKRKITPFSRRRMLYPFISAAASVIILLSLYFIVQNGQEEIKSYQSEIIENSHDNESANKIPVISNEIEKVNNKIIKTNKSKHNKTLNKQIIKQNNNHDTSDQDIIASVNEKEIMHYIDPVKIELNNNSKSPNIVNRYNYYVVEQVENERNLKTYLSNSFNKYVLQKDKKEKVEWFDIAQASIKGINKVTGTNMALERVYDEKGNPKSTEFNSKLIAFSAPIKKD